MDGIYDIRNIVAMQLKKSLIDLPLDPLWDILVSGEGTNISILTTGGYIQYTRQELLDGLKAFLNKIATEEDVLVEVEKGPLCVISCGEHGYFKIWGNWPSYDPPTFTTNLEEAFKYDVVPGIFDYLQDIRDTLERQGYGAVIRKVEDVANAKNIAI